MYPFGDHIFARITDATEDVEGSNRWVYDFEEVCKTSPGYDGWSARTEGRTGTAFNFRENINSDLAGIQGNGIDTGGPLWLNVDFEIQPVPVGTIVVLYAVRLVDSIEWWFGYENAVDGDCGE